MIEKKIYKNNKAGFFVLTMTLLVGATVLIIVMTALLRSVNEMKGSSNSEMSLKAWSVVNACGEYAVLQLSSTTDTLGWGYTGNSSLSIGDQSCYIYPIVDGVLGSKIVKASSTVSGFTKKIKIDIATNTPKIKINTWEEVADF